jgi:hypothetical protein
VSRFKLTTGNLILQHVLLIGAAQSLLGLALFMVLPTVAAGLNQSVLAVVTFIVPVLIIAAWPGFGGARGQHGVVGLVGTLLLLLGGVHLLRRSTRVPAKAAGFMRGLLSALFW